MQNLMSKEFLTGLTENKKPLTFKPLEKLDEEQIKKVMSFKNWWGQFKTSRDFTNFDNVYRYIGAPTVNPYFRSNKLIGDPVHIWNYVHLFAEKYPPVDPDAVAAQESLKYVMNKLAEKAHLFGREKGSVGIIKDDYEPILLYNSDYKEKQDYIPLKKEYADHLIRLKSKHQKEINELKENEKNIIERNKIKEKINSDVMNVLKQKKENESNVISQMEEKIKEITKDLQEEKMSKAKVENQLADMIKDLETSNLSKLKIGNQVEELQKYFDEKIFFFKTNRG